jgi:L-malate glycosyltransferase
MRPKILIVENSTGTTGAFNAIFAHVRSLEDKFEFHFAIRRGSEVREKLSEYNIPYLELPYSEIRKHWSVIFYLPLLLVNSLKLKRYCKLNSISLIHVNDLYNMVGVAIKMMDSTITVIYHVRLLQSSYAGILYRRWIKMIGAKADQVLTVSESVNKQVQQILPLSKKIRTIYDFVSLDGATTVSSNSKTVKFVYPANYIPGKGHEYALEAFSRALKNNPDIFLEMRGGDLGLANNKRFKDSLDLKVREMSLGHAIAVNGSYKALRDILSGVDVVLMFSESESFSMVCYEAMFYGVPVVATRCGGPEELIVDEVSGILVPNTDIAAMERAILKLATDYQTRQKIGRRAAAEIRKCIAEHNSPEQLSNVYITLLNPVTFTK